MSGGIAYVLDADGEFIKHCNTAMVDLEPVVSDSEQTAKVSADLWHLGQSDENILKRLIEHHARYTNSRRAQVILDKWAEYRARFVKVFPREYRRALTELARRTRRRLLNMARSPDFWNTSGCRRRARPPSRERSIIANSFCTYRTKRRRSRAHAAWIAASRSACRVPGQQYHSGLQ